MQTRFIDYRFRPPAKSFLDTYHYRHSDRTANTSRKFGLQPPARKGRIARPGNDIAKHLLYDL